ncbi:MAG: hypothetical protein U9M90_01775 [Patescibacteria group bacterium]|nr:hypothetical protein [Patescibacteria group bacterium]
MKHQKPKKKRKSDSFIVSFETLTTFRKFFSVIFFIIVFLNIFAYIIVKAQSASKSLENTASSFMHQKVINEQTKHFSDSRNIVEETRKNVWVIEEYVVEIENGKRLSKKKKAELSTKLKIAEENSFRLSRAFDEYFSDQSIQYYSGSNEKITNYIYETAFLRIALDRMVRTTEALVLFRTLQYEQRDIFLENFYDVLWQLDHLNELKEELSF